LNRLSEKPFRLSVSVFAFQQDSEMAIKARVSWFQGDGATQRRFRIIQLPYVRQCDVLHKQRPRRLGIEFHGPRQILHGFFVEAEEIRTHTRKVVGLIPIGGERDGLLRRP